ncbi:MAG TPA: glutaredoxin domain-containing protein [Pseudonocardia sp.]|nr:glutaredoxin domain-containing protein [Pseudonocardia sp.]
MAESRSIAAPVLTVYWRPGCPFCIRLRRALIQARVPVAWQNIWTDPEHAAFVRSVADGNETVPTVVLDGRAHVNPAPRALLDMVGQAHPELSRLPSVWAAWRAFRLSRH